MENRDYALVPNEDGNVQEEEVNLRDYFMVIRRRKWMVLLALVATISSTIAYVRVTKPVWEAKVVMVYEKTNQATIAGLVDKINLLTPDLDIDVQKAFLASPLVATEIQGRLVKEHGMQDFTCEQIEELLKLSSAKGGKNSAVIELSAQAGMPSHAALLANVGADVLISKNTEQKREELDRATAFLESQMTKLDNLLREREKELGIFREKEGIVPTISREGTVVGGLLEQLGKLQENAIQTEIEVAQTKARLDSVRKLITEKRKNLSPDVQTMGVTFTPQIEALRNRLVQVETDLYAKEQSLTPEHPEVVALKEQVAAIQKQLQGELGKLQVTGESLDPIVEWQTLIAQGVQLEVEFEGLQQKKRLLDGMVDKFKTEHPDLAEQDFQLRELERKRRRNEESYLQLEGKSIEINLLREMKVSDMRVIKGAKEKDALIIKPKKKLTLMLGGVLGIMLGIGIAFFLEYLDDTVRTEEDVKKLTGLPVIGIIPKFNGNEIKQALPESATKRKLSKDYKRQLLELIGRKLTKLSKGPVAESYRTIRNNIRYARYANVNGPVQAILLTSAAPKEGKSLTLVNLAISLAWSGKRTVLVDGDLHRPKLHYVFGVLKSPGLSDFLIADPERPKENLFNFIQGTGIENLFVISSGELPPNPGDLLTSPRIATLIEYLKKEFDMILLDSPPLNVVSDASLLAPQVDTNILLVRAGSSRRSVVVQAKETIQSVGGKIFGVIINERNARSSHYSYYYSSKEEE